MFDEFGERELSEVIVESVKKLARLLALVILCLYTMKAGEEDVETLDAEGTEESFFCNGAEREEAAGGLYGSGLEAEEAADGLYANGVENEEAVGDLYAGGTGEERQVGSSGGDRAEGRDGLTGSMGNCILRSSTNYRRSVNWRSVFWRKRKKTGKRRMRSLCR